MTIRFNADEIFKMAEKIEENGAAFYRRAAELHPSEHNKQFLTKLAVMEEEHQQKFSAMRAELPESEKEETAHDPMDEGLLYLKALADVHGGEGSPDAVARLSGKETMKEILLIAIDLEKKSILFYGGMKDLVPASLGAGKIDGIIAEEKSHVVTLSRELVAVRKGG